MDGEKFSEVEDLLIAGLNHSLCCLLLASDSTSYADAAVMSIMGKLSDIPIHDMLFVPTIDQLFNEFQGSEVFIIREASIYLRSHLSQSLFEDLVDTMAHSCTFYVHDRFTQSGENNSRDIRNGLNESEYLLESSILKRLGTLEASKRMLLKNPPLLFLVVLRMQTALVLAWLKSLPQTAGDTPNYHEIKTGYVE